MSLFRTIVSGLLLVILFIAAPPQAAQDESQNEEVEYAPTPTSLAELLGPEGSDGASYDYFIHSTSYDYDIDNFDVLVESENDRTIRHARFETIEGQIVFSQEFWWINRNGRGTYRHVYSASGELVEYQSMTDSSKSMMTIDAVLENGAYARTICINYADGSDPDSAQTSVDPVHHENSIPEAWQDLAIAYHLRASAHHFEIRTHSELFMQDKISVCHFEYSGTQEVVFQGEQVTAHTLHARSHVVFLDNLDDPRSLADYTMLVLIDGTIISSRWDDGLKVENEERIAAEEAAELIGETTKANDTE